MSHKKILNADARAALLSANEHGAITRSRSGARRGIAPLLDLKLISVSHETDQWIVYHVTELGALLVEEWAARGKGGELESGANAPTP